MDLIIPSLFVEENPRIVLHKQGYRNMEGTGRSRAAGRENNIEKLYTIASARKNATSRLSQQVLDVLSVTPGGEKLARYFGITGGRPVQSPAEAAAVDSIITALRGGADGSSNLLEALQRVTDSSPADPHALRACMYGSAWKQRQADRRPH